MAKKAEKGPVEEIFGITPEVAKELLATLTGREREVVDLLVTGGKPRDLAKELGISPKTFDIHRANIRMKFRSRTSIDVARIVFAARVGERFQ